jgi:3-dehydroquinate synthase
VAEILVGAGEAAYRVVVARGASRGLGARLREDAGASPVMVIADDTTAALLGAALAEAAGATLHRVADGEASKSFAELERACTAAAAAGLDRGSTIVAVGGGVVGGLAGTVAAVYMRGVRLVHVPTTLLAMVDSSIGGKAAVNLPQGKNLVGAFKPPAAVHVDPDLLLSLPPRQLRSGLAEVLKCSMIADEQLYGSLLANHQKLLDLEMDLLTDVVTTCCAIKAGVVTRDERETGERAILNYGHTFGHGLEAATGYATLTHGEAVAVGMAVAARIGVEVGVTPADVEARQDELLDAYGMARRAPGAAGVEDVLAAIGHDKKARGGSTPWVLLESVGRATPGHDVPGDVVRGAAAWALGA